MNNSIKFMEAAEIAARLGRRIRLARQHRKLRQSDIAASTGFARSTIQAIERGDTSCSIGVLLQILWVLNLTQEVEFVASPSIDRDGLALSLDRETQRVYLPRKVENDF